MSIFCLYVYLDLNFFKVSKKKILLKKEQKEKYIEFTVVNKEKKETKSNKQPLSYSKRQKKIHVQNNPRDPNTKTNQRASVSTNLTTEPEISQYHHKNADYVQFKQFTSNKLEPNSKCRNYVSPSKDSNKIISLQQNLA